MAILWSVSNKALLGRIQDAFKAIDEVHGDGQLPRIEVVDFKPVRGVDTMGGYHKCRISVSSAVRAPMLVTVHEVAHMLADHVFRPRNPAAPFAPDSDLICPEFRVWWVAIKSSKAYRMLDERLLRLGVPERETEQEASDLHYLRSSEELWARSYSQFVAVTSSNAQLKAEFIKARAQSEFEYWSDRDFSVILSSMDSILKARGWR